MQVEFMVSISGENVTAHSGDVLDASLYFTDDEITRLIQGGVCVPVGKKVEAAATRKAKGSDKTFRSAKD